MMGWPTYKSGRSRPWTFETTLASSFVLLMRFWEGAAAGGAPTLLRGFLGMDFYRLFQADAGVQEMSKVSIDRRVSGPLRATPAQLYQSGLHPPLHLAERLLKIDESVRTISGHVEAPYNESPL